MLSLEASQGADQAYLGHKYPQFLLHKYPQLLTQISTIFTWVKATNIHSFWGWSLSVLILVTVRSV